MSFMINPYWCSAVTPSSGVGFRYSHQFDGVDEGVSISHVDTYSFQDPFTFSYRIKRDVSGTFSKAVFNISNSSGKGILLNFWSGYPSLILKGDDGKVMFVRTVNRFNLADKWYSIIVTYDGSINLSGVKIYVDGVSVSLGYGYLGNNLLSSSGFSSEDITFCMGYRDNSSYVYLSARLDDVQFYDFELNSTQVSDIYNSGYVTAPTASPIHHWKLGEEDTFSTNWTVKDSIGSTDGTSVNMEEEDRKLGVAYSMEFDGVDEYIDFGNIFTFDRNNAFSFSFWVNFSSLSQSGAIISKVLSSGTYQGVLINLVGSRINFSINDGLGGPSNAILVSSSVLSTNTWYHFTVTYDGSSLRSGMNLYNNGVLDNAYSLLTSISGDINASTSFNIAGRNNTTSYTILGDVMEVSKFDTELSASDVALLYNTTGTNNGVPIDPRDVGLSPTFYTPLGGENDSFNGTDWTIVDEINGNNGTSVNMEEADKTSETP